MPRADAPPPPSGVFNIRYSKPFSGSPTQDIEVIGESNSSAVVKVSNHDGHTTTQKVGDVPKDDVNELMALISTCRGFPSHSTKDVYGHDTRLDFSTFELQWSNQDDDPTASTVSEIAPEQKDGFKRVADSIEALARTFAK